MPAEKLEKLIKKHKVDKADADVLVKNLVFVDFAEELAKSLDLAKYVSWVTIELLRVLNYKKKTLEDEDVEIKPAHLAELLAMVDKGEITVLKAKQIMNDFVPKSFSVKEKLGKEIGKLSDEDTKKLVEQAIKENPKVWEEYKGGKKESLNFLMGCVMKLSNRRADFGKVREMFEKR
jgi:aspartyl-tRNA(Asn)/glutamyl-tRNA(Gln) amidotransferase subunit B